MFFHNSQCKCFMKIKKNKMIKTLRRGHVKKKVEQAFEENGRPFE